MSNSGERTPPLKPLTLGDFDPKTDQTIEDDFIGRVIAGRYTARLQRRRAAAIIARCTCKCSSESCPVVRRRSGLHAPKGL